MDRKRSFHSPLLVMLIAMSLVLSACVENSGGGKGRRTSSTQGGETTDTPTPGDSSGGNGAGPSDGSVGTIGDNILANGRAELRHIIDPFTGTYKTKVTIPKNYKGLLYISGLNITSLNDKLISVRFKFGREKEEVIIPATIGRASGIIPQTDVEVLILDMEDQPFQDLRLLYDFFDYNDYDTNDDGVEFGAGDDFSAPTNDVRDSGLYCRGLMLEDDPTFTISTTNDKCDASGETCLYAYAKIKDSGLYYDDNGNPTAINPSEPQIDITGDGYATQSQAELLKKCLPDQAINAAMNEVLQSISPAVNSSSSYSTTYNSANGGFTYKGPYRALNRDFWEISGDAVLSPVASSSASGTEPTGIFQDTVPGYIAAAGESNPLAVAGQKSFLFPRAGKMDLQANLEYVGLSSLAVGIDVENSVRSVRSLVSAGESDYVDGCNLRVANYDDFRNEGISSCNVTGTIELVYNDPDTGELVTLTTSREIKLQLSRTSQTDFEGNEVNYSALKKCSNSNACGANECCFNERCWSRSLVSQCIEDQPGEGNLGVGEACGSDFQCSSLCCSSASGSCSVHNPGEDRFCSKAPGQKCVTKEFCRKENVYTCFIVKTGVNNQGDPTCTRRCYNVPTFGECNADGTCAPPKEPDVPDFDPNNPDCSQAIDPPTNL